MSSNNVKCYICASHEDNVIEYGEFLPKNDTDSFKVHYFCVLLSNDTPQNGTDNEGIYGFLINDIKNTARNYNKTKCKFCRKGRANARCPIKLCRISFHPSCAIKNNCLAQFIEPENFHIYCQIHSPKIRIDIRQRTESKIRVDILDQIKGMNSSQLEKDAKFEELVNRIANRQFQEGDICKICGESFTVNDIVNVITPPCCWSHNGLTPNYGVYGIHRDCVKFQAFFAGYKFKCPFCGDSGYFLNWVNEIGIFVPQRHALWEDSELENRSLLGITATCCAEICHCPNGREYTTEEKEDDFYLFLCYTCGSQAIHRKCLELPSQESTYEYKCDICHISVIQQNRYDNESNVVNNEPMNIETNNSQIIELHDTDSEPEFTAEQLFEEMDEIKPVIVIPKPIPLAKRKYYVQQRNHFRFQIQNWVREQRENGTWNDWNK